MPYGKMSEVNKAVRGIKPAVTLPQANRIAEWADAIDDETLAWPIAIAQFKRLYKAEGGKWVLRKEKEMDTEKKALQALDDAIAACARTAGRIALGGPGSGNWAHAGRPGVRGGSALRSSGGMSIARGRDWQQRQAAASSVKKWKKQYIQNGGDPEGLIRSAENSIEKSPITKTELLRAGGRVSIEPGSDRIYFDNKERLLGLTFQRGADGSLSSAKIDGQNINPSMVWSTAHFVRETSFFVNSETGMLNFVIRTPGINKTIKKHITNGLVDALRENVYIQRQIEAGVTL